MILRTLTLDGVGPYADRQTLEFAASERRPVTLVGGLNGAGKTTLIRSLFQALYGARALAELGSHRSYGAFLAGAINHERTEATLELKLVIPGLRDNAPLMVRRSWGEKARADRLDVFVEEAYDEELSESWDETIEQIAPLGVARLFFFDGEKIEALADLGSAADSLRTAVGSLLGLDLVSQLQTDLVAVQRRVLRAGGSVSSEGLEKKQAELAAAEEILAEARREAEAAESALESAEEAHRQAESAARAAGGDLVAERGALEAKAGEASEEESSIWQRLRELAADPFAPLCLVPSLLEGMLDAAEHERREMLGKDLLDVLAQRDSWVVAEAERLGLANAEGLRDALASDRRSRQGQGEPPPFAPLSSPEAIKSTCAERLTDWRVEALGAIDSLDKALRQTDDLDRRISKIPHDESVGKLLEAVEESRARVEALREQLRGVQQHLSVAERKVEAARERRDAEIARLSEAEDSDERQQRVMQHAERAKQTLGRLSTRIAERHVDRISAYALQSLEQLLRKDRLIQGVEIDPESFAVTLYGAHGTLHPSALSAGERQLTALSLLWALARAAGRPLPVVIDTPLGRLDASHRQHVIKRYLPAASHQVVVLSTDTEIDAGLHKLLRPSIGAEQCLITDPEGRTEIDDGYFELAAA
ncbi:MAG: DNA sulfur modification protein DndD [Solirubrobacterales bacterium]